ncbi:MAG: formylglycine-generating enzyme family protein [Saprospiraceae bacterium]
MIPPTRPVHHQAIPGTPGFDMVFVEGGSFLMGGEKYDWEKPVHPVQVSDCWMGRHPVTQWLWDAVLKLGNPSYFKGKNRPVENVSWYDAAVFCNALNKLCDYEPCYFGDPEFKSLFGKTGEGYSLPNEGEVFRKVAAKGYRLPTEAEWEYAARGGKDPEKRARFEYAGGEKLDELGWYDDNSHGETKPVGLKLPNELGLCDMSGNVWEWCEDQWHSNYKGAPADGSAWVGREQGTHRVVRGGSWFGSAEYCRTALRYDRWPRFRNGRLGFRLALSYPPV